MKACDTFRNAAKEGELKVTLSSGRLSGSNSLSAGNGEPDQAQAVGDPSMRRSYRLGTTEWRPAKFKGVSRAMTRGCVSRCTNPGLGNLPLKSHASRSSSRSPSPAGYAASVSLESLYICRLIDSVALDGTTALRRFRRMERPLRAMRGMPVALPQAKRGLSFEIRAPTCCLRRDGLEHRRLVPDARHGDGLRLTDAIHVPTPFLEIDHTV